MKVTNDYITEIERRAHAATPVEWVADHEFPDSVRGPSALRVTVFSCRRHQDVEFIAHAREDIPRLIAEVRSLREQNTLLRLQVSTGAQIIRASIAGLED